jgi:hypothetical protein
MSKHIYYITYGKSGSVIKSPQETIRFSFTDAEEDETIYEGRIGDFFSFENQIKEQLGVVGFQKEGLFRKNVACVSIPIDSTPIDKRNIFYCFDQIGFSEVYLINQHIALVRSLKHRFSTVKTFGIIDVDADKIDISVVEESRIVRKSSFKFSQERQEQYRMDSTASELILKLIASDVKWVFEHFLSAQSFQVFLTGSHMEHYLDFGKYCQGAFQNPVVFLENSEELVISGLVALGIQKPGEG